MSRRTRDEGTIIAEGRNTCRNWAQAFVERHGAVHEPDHMHQLYERERASGDHFRVCMSQMEFLLFVVCIVHYTSEQIAAKKVREVAYIASAEITRREYWNQLDRAAHYAAGLTQARAAVEPQAEVV